MQVSLLIFNINQFIFYLCTVNIDFEYHKYFEYLENDTLWVCKRKNWNCVLSISLYDTYSFYLSHLTLMKRKYTNLLFSLLFSFFIIIVLDFHCIFYHSIDLWTFEPKTDTYNVTTLTWMTLSYGLRFFAHT